MPIYDLRCDRCSHVWEEYIPPGIDPFPCPYCSFSPESDSDFCEKHRSRPSYDALAAEYSELRDSLAGVIHFCDPITTENDAALERAYAALKIAEERM